MLGEAPQNVINAGLKSGGQKETGHKKRRDETKDTCKHSAEDLGSNLSTEIFEAGRMYCYHAIRQ